MFRVLVKRGMNQAMFGGTIEGRFKVQTRGQTCLLVFESPSGCFTKG